jgi:hypothetical protein
MDKDTRNAIERATQRARKLLEEDFAAQLEGEFDVHRDGALAAKPGGHLSARQVFQRERIITAIEHKRSAGMSPADAVCDYLRDAAFTTLNRFVALKMLEARELMQECITKGEQSAGYREFCGMAPGLPLLPDSTGYRIYIESLFDELSTEVKVLFDRRDPSSVLWPKRATFEEVLEILNSGELERVWGQDETIGWVYQYFNREEDRRAARYDKDGKPKSPRNSRDLAVRNQFFTPRYVVQFLADNTLGRIWYEMRSTKTLLSERCEYMVRKRDDNFAPRAKKDPRDLYVLDPACGSGHFLLYAFDLLLTIYEEAYGDSESPKSEATGKTLAEDYLSLDALRKAVPGQILAHNLHGVDIDPRCAQIAQLALWLRAQKAYRDYNIERAERVPIRRSNIVVAEPLVVDDQIAKEFVAKLRDVELGRVFTALVESLDLAGDMGLLLRIEQLVSSQGQRGKTENLFSPSEERIRTALERFVREEEGATNTRRRLFVDDAAHGVSLLSVAGKKFDVVLMNPPFGAGSVRAKKEFEKAYPRSKNDIYAAFVERSLELLASRGRVGAITSRTGFFLSSYHKWREEILLSNVQVVAFADLGEGVMDAANVEAAAYCIENGEQPGSSDNCSVFLDGRHCSDKEGWLRQATASLRCDSTNRRYELNPLTFKSLPGDAFVYQAPESMLRLAASGNTLVSLGVKAQQGFGASTRFHRLYWEVGETDIGPEKQWMYLAHGTKPAPFYKPTTHVVLWDGCGREAKADVIARYPYLKGNYTFKIQAEADYGRPGLCYGKRTTQFTVQVMPSGHAFSFEGTAIHVRSDRLDSWSLLALLNSRIVSAWLNLVCAQHKTYNYLDALPIPPSIGTGLGVLARSAWSLQRRKDSVNETSKAFVLPVELYSRCGGFNLKDIEDTLGVLTQELEEETNRIYGIDGNEVECLLEAGKSALSEGRLDQESADNSELDGEAEDGDGVNESEYSGGGDGCAVASWIVGIVFGRFDPRLATGERPIPTEPDPFEALPSRSPGMFPEGEEPLPRIDILVDDEGHADDITAHVLALADRIQVDVPEYPRGWLAKEFFPLHIKMYSKSRRKAPIYWQIATPSTNYSVWLYIHAFSKDTLFRVQNDYVAPKLAHEERRLDSLTNELRDGATASQRKQLVAQELFVEELRAFLEEVKRVAPLWNPNLDDGVIINFAPLWRLVPQNKSWQKELKSTWDALCDGTFDWAHLAMHLWPERVVPKCAKDRSLAIAHELEDVFWIEESDAKWTARKTPTRSVDELVRERTSPAVKSALKSLLEAPMATGNVGRGRSRRGRTAADAGGGEV